MTLVSVICTECISMDYHLRTYDRINAPSKLHFMIVQPILNRIVNITHGEKLRGLILLGGRRAKCVCPLSLLHFAAHLNEEAK